MDAELLPTFLEEARQRLATIVDAAISRRDRIDTAHGLKGAAGIAGVEEVRLLAARLETALREGDDAGAGRLHREIEEALAALVASGSGRVGRADTPAPSPYRPAAALSEWDPAEAELLRGVFLEEADDHLRRIGEAQQIIARDPTARAALDELFRCVHTLKGSAGSVGFEGVSSAAHELEELCAEIRAGHLMATPGILDRIDEGVDGLRAMLEGARAAPRQDDRSARPPDEGPAAAPGARARFDRRRPADRRGAGSRSIRVESERLDSLLDGVGELVILRTRIERRVRELEGVLKDLGLSRDTLQGAVAPLRLREEGQGDATALERLGEVGIEFTDAIAHLDRATQALVGESESLRRTTGELEEQLRRARLIPLEWLFQRVSSGLRELGRSEGKLVELTTAGGETELDKSVVEQITDPLIHMVRNAMAHGIEPPAVRRSRGKPEAGSIRIAARCEGDFVHLDLSDDGAGIDREAVRRKLATVGGLSADAPLDQHALIAAIFEPGFSTRSVPDELAGRGVGLDAVRETVLRLGGQITVDSSPGQGTHFRLRLPLTTAITQALLFKVGGQVYAIPAAHVVEALPLDAGALTDDGRYQLPGAAPDGSGKQTPIPVIRLQALLGAEMPPGRKVSALHIRFDERHFVATCDKIIGPRVIVVRSLGPLLGALPLFAGVTLSGSGKAQLVLDLGALAEAAFRPAVSHRRTDRGDRALRVLLVDDSRLGRETGARILTGAGYQAVTAEDGWEAWELLGERRFDVVVTDLEMPRMDGIELLTRIRRESTLRGLPVVVLSSRTSDLMRERARAAGANLFVAKSPIKRALTDALAAVLKHASLAGAARAPGSGKI